MITVFKCTFPDGKIFIGKTRLNWSKYIDKIYKKAKSKPDSVFLWNLSKVNLSDVKWANYGSYWSSADANKKYMELIAETKSYDRNFGYNYLTKNGTGWSKKLNSMEKSSVSRLKSRMLKLSKNIKDAELKMKVEHLIEELDLYYAKIKDSKQ
jgi:hypothetical protein